MQRILKIVLGLFGALLLLLLVAAIGVTLFIDPNDYRDTIASKVEAQTGRTLAIEGDIKLSLFPWLGLELGAMELGNAEGFADQPFARIGAAEARVKLLPLLKLQTEIDTVLLRGLVLNLQRRADGVSNWDDLAKGGEAPAVEVDQPQGEAGGETLQQLLAALAIGGIALEEANIEWRDELLKQRFALNNLNFRAGEIRIAAPIPLQLATEFVSIAPELSGSLQLAAEVTADPLAQRYAASGMTLRTALSGAALPGGKLEAEIGGNATVDLAAQTLSVAPLNLAIPGLELKVTMQGQQLLEQLRFSGELASSEFVPRQLLQGLGIELPEMADPAALGKARLVSRFSGGLDEVALSGLSLQLDESTLSGDASLRNFAAPVIRYTLLLDTIDVDRYLPPPSEAPAAPVPATPATAGAVAATELPLELLRALNIDGTLRLGKVKAMNLRSDTIVTTLKAEKGRFRLHPLTANLYQGSYSGNVAFDVSGKVAQLSMDERLGGVESGPLLKDFMGKEYVTGTAELQAKLNASGIEPQAIRSSLNGNGSFSFVKGAVKGFNLGQLIRNAEALYNKQPPPKEAEKATDFSELRGSFTVKNGLVTTGDLSARSPLFQVAGSGTVNLVSERLDLRLDTTIVSDLRDAAGERGGELRGEKIPVTIGGSFSEPKFGVDLASVLEAKARAEIDKKRAEIEADLERRKRAAELEAQKRLEDEKKKLEQQMQDKLKKMLKF
ncbi:MAG: AsmA family protein [Gammaproteobacteria bacterium]|nr:AsmA family protein [Gammaproteobacteria bacterium]